ncbi:Ankyrin repeat and BTB/POZ domain-containing protein 1 [Pleodorina starrii]|nr:Ankyrin repeat and BTB/POZ domain-containing protein 1 [Pleodorina starrii]GLC63168.1 Ankyrin repeat and BTB/POZ domain-containing protein 1 [Pleodorina starrii]
MLRDVLVFLGDEIRQLLPPRPTDAGPTAAAAAVPGPYRLSDRSLPLEGETLRNARAAAYEPTTDCVVFAAGGGGGGGSGGGGAATAIMRLDGRTNAVSLLAGSLDGGIGVGASAVDGVGATARFRAVLALATDGRGTVFVADGYGGGGGSGRSASGSTGASGSTSGSFVRAVMVDRGEVVSLPGSEAPPGSHWVALAYDAVGRRLLAATWYGVYDIPLPDPDGERVSGGGGGVEWVAAAAAGGTAAAAPRLIAGGWAGAAAADGAGAAARFCFISAIAAGVYGSVYVNDWGAVRLLDAAGVVTTLRTAAEWGRSLQWHMALLPGGLALACSSSSRGDGADTVHIIGDRAAGAAAGFAPACEVLAGWRRRRWPTHGSAVAAAAAAAMQAEALYDTPTGVVTIRLDGGTAFTADAAVLATHSEFFARLLRPGGGFADSGAAEVALPDAHPGAFEVLLSYMYGGPQQRHQPPPPAELLRPTAELGGRLLVRPDCMRWLTSALMAEVTRGSVVSDLVWAERHGMSDLVQQLESYLLRHRELLTASGGGGGRGCDELEELAARCPHLAASIIRKLAAMAPAPATAGAASPSQWGW